MSLDSIVEHFHERNLDDVLKGAKAFFQFPVIPEYLTSEVLMASCYRALGYPSLRDCWISPNGKELWKLVSSPKGFQPPPYNCDEVQRLLRDVLLSPEDPKQKRGQKYSDFLFLAPLVPSTALFSNPIRLSRNITSTGGNPWNVETLFKALVAYSARDSLDGTLLWNRLFTALSVQEGTEDDCFARIIERFLQACSAHMKDHGFAAEQLPVWEQGQNDIREQGKFFISDSDRGILAETGPLDEIRNGLLLVLDLKPKFSRWQWLTMLDAELRISMMAFVMWLLDLHHVASNVIQKYILEGTPIPNLSCRDFFRQLCSEGRAERTEDVFCYGEGFSKAQSRVVARYARDRIRIAFFLDAAKELNPSKFDTLDWSSVEGFVSSLKSFSSDFNQPQIRKSFNDGYMQIVDAAKGELNPKKGRLKHLLEFFAVLRQKNVVESQRDFIRYDQSFLVRKKGGCSRAPFIVDLGSVACFVIVYCCARGRRVFPKTDLLRHLEKFYVTIRPTHDDQFVEHLKGLGLTMDSPDAGGGLMILNPFFGEEHR